MARTFFRMVFTKSSEITNNKPIFSQYNIFYNYEYFFFSLRFDLFSIIAKEVNQIRNNAVCAVARLVFLFCCALTQGPLQCFSTYFRILKEVGVLGPIVPDYVISCGHGNT